MIRRTFLVATIATAVAAVALVGCDQHAPPEEIAVRVPKAVIDTVAQKRVLFAHQSVGGEVLKGVTALAAEANGNLAVTETRELTTARPGIFHFKVGANGNPKGKLEDFAAALNQSPTKPDVALLKLCYIDFDESTDGAALATQYIAAIDQLQAQHPSTRIVAVTAPLTTVQTGPKAWIKKLLGKQPGGYAVNARRQAFNSALRARFREDALFDIAQVEFNGARGDNSPQTLDPNLTYDGGHLNDAGQKKVAAAFLEFLARMPGPSHEHPAGA